MNAESMYGDRWFIGSRITVHHTFLVDPWSYVRGFGPRRRQAFQNNSEDI